MEVKPLEIVKCEVIPHTVGGIQTSATAGKVETKPHKCNVCDYACKRPSHLKRHLLIHTRRKLHNCDVCDYATENSNHFKRHKLLHIGEKLHKCTVCDYRSNRLDHLKSHALVHLKEKRYKCATCDFACNDLVGFKRHKLVHSSREGSYECKVCDRVFILKSDLIKHQRFMHRGEKQYKCIVCEYACDHLPNLKRHVLTHGREFCDQEGQLKKHKSKQEETSLEKTVETLHTCMDCDYYTTSVFSLQKHLLQHSDLNQS